MVIRPCTADLSQTTASVVGSAAAAAAAQPGHVDVVKEDLGLVVGHRRDGGVLQVEFETFEIYCTASKTITSLPVKLSIVCQ